MSDTTPAKSPPATTAPVDVVKQSYIDRETGEKKTVNVRILKRRTTPKQ